MNNNGTFSFLSCSGCGFRAQRRVVDRRSVSTCRRRRWLAVLRAVSSVSSNAAPGRWNRSVAWLSKWISKPKMTSMKPRGSVWPSPKKRARKTGKYYYGLCLRFCSSQQYYRLRRRVGCLLVSPQPPSSQHLMTPEAPQLRADVIRSHSEPALSERPRNLLRHVSCSSQPAQ